MQTKLLGDNMENPYILLWCLICKDATPHTITDPKCIRCRDKDRQDMEEALERFRRAEGAQSDLFEGEPNG